ncbi:MAG: hypothetical protein IJ697_06260 [Synergistaceae bacterium]|nr:hypothetical protein [Synergistaceae bacterium]
MRRFCFWAMLAVMLCTAGIAGAADSVPPNPFSGFGIYTSYVTSGSITLSSSGLPDYSGVKVLKADSLRFGGKFRDNWKGNIQFPRGTLTVVSSDSPYQGRKYPLESTYSDVVNSEYMPDYSGRFIDYRIMYSSGIEEFIGGKVMWNLYTSPDIITGSAIVPKIEELKSVSIGKNDIVPFIKLTPNNSRYTGELYFVKSGDWGVPVAVNIPVVTVRGNYSGGSYNDFTKSVPARITLEDSYLYGDELEVSYERGNALYTWKFKVPEYRSSSSIEWRDLELAKQPLTLKTGDKKSITIKLPSALKLSDDFADSEAVREMIAAGNTSVIEVDYSSVKFTQGKGWENDSVEDKSVLSFTLNAGVPGRTVLEIYIPREGRYFREINVTDENGKLDIPEGKSSLYPVFRKVSRVALVEGRPYYPSADEGGVYITSIAGMTGASKEKRVFYDINGDRHEEEEYADLRGHFGFVNGSLHQVNGISLITYPLDAGVGTDFYFSRGSRFNTQDIYDNSEYASTPSFGNVQELENVKIWLEFPDRPALNLTSAPVPSIVSLDKILTVEQQLEQFVPYLQLKRSSLDIDRVVSCEWSFVKVNADGTTQKVKPSGITDLYIDGERVEGTEGTIDFAWYVDANYSDFSVSYTYNGVDYSWEFNPMETDYSSGMNIPSVSAGQTAKGTVMFFEDSENVASVEALLWDADILTITPSKFTSKDINDGKISFDVRGLKNGTTTISFVRKNIEPYYPRYLRLSQTVTVREKTSDSGEDDGEFKVSFAAPTVYLPLIEGKSYYDENQSFPEGVSIFLERKLRTATLYGEDFGNADGIAYLSVDIPADLPPDAPLPPTTSTMLSPYYSDPYVENGIEYVTLRYIVDFSCMPGETVIWEFYSPYLKNGSYTIPDGIKAVSPETRRPYVKFNRKGINVESVEWYFVDSKDNKIDVPSGITAMSVDVRFYTGNSEETLHYDSKSGSVPVNMPELFLRPAEISFMEDGFLYRWIFNPVDFSNPNDFIPLDWDAGKTQLPLMLYVGDSKTVTLSVPNNPAENITALIGNSDIAGIETVSSTDKTITVKLTGKSAGMTTLSMTYQMSNGEGRYVSLPREIWVASKNASTGKYEIPGLTDDAEALMKTLEADGNTSRLSGWTTYPESSSGGTTPVSPEPVYDETPKNVGLQGLSVLPRFAMPKDPSPDAYNAVWDFVDGLNLPYGVDVFDDWTMKVIASRDATKVFNELKDDLINKETPQLLAVVLPEMQINSSGFYMFRVPVDNIKGGVKEIFFEPSRSKDIVVSSDIYRYRYYDEDEREDKTRQMFIDDSGNVSGAVDGNSYINVAAYLIHGRYKMIITAEATSNDVAIVKGLKPSEEKPAEEKPAEETKPDDENKVPDTAETETKTDGTAVSVRGHAPRVNLEEVSDTLRTSLGRSNAPVLSMDVSSFRELRTSADIPSGQLAGIVAQGRKVEVILPVVSVDKAAIYIFGVSLDNLPVGSPIFLDMTMTNQANVSAAETYSEDYTFLDDSGTEVYTVPANKHVNVAAYLEPGYTYSPVITTSSSSGEGESVGVGSSTSGGCSAGLTFSGAVMLLGLAVLKRKR